MYHKSQVATVLKIKETLMNKKLLSLKSLMLLTVIAKSNFLC